MVPLATALAGPAEQALGRTTALWGCATLVVVVTAAVLCVPDVRNLTRRTKALAQGAPVLGASAARGGAAGQAGSPAAVGVPGSADAEGSVGRLG